MDPAGIGALIGFSVLIGCGGLRYCYEVYTKRRRDQIEKSLMVANPLLVRKHSRVKNLFV